MREAKARERNGYIGNALHQVDFAILGSCTCLTKTPVTEYHDKTCRYYKLIEAQKILQSCIERTP